MRKQAQSTRNCAESCIFRILDFRRIPPVSGRLVNITKEIRDITTDKKLAKTFFISPGEPRPRGFAHVGSASGPAPRHPLLCPPRQRATSASTGSAPTTAPPSTRCVANPTSWRAPWPPCCPTKPWPNAAPGAAPGAAPTTRARRPSEPGRGHAWGICGVWDGEGAAWVAPWWSSRPRHPCAARRWELNPNYCAQVRQTPPYDRGHRLLDLIDMTVLDFLMGEPLPAGARGENPPSRPAHRQLGGQCPVQAASSHFSPSIFQQLMGRPWSDWLSTMRVLSLPVPLSQIWDQRTDVCVGEAARPIPAPNSRPRGPHVNPSPHPFPSLLQATWTGTTTRPSRNSGTTPSCFTWTTAAGKGGEGDRPPQRRGHSRGRGMLRVLDDCGPKHQPLLGCFGAHWGVLGHTGVFWGTLCMPRCHPNGFLPQLWQALARRDVHPGPAPAVLQVSRPHHLSFWGKKKTLPDTEPSFLSIKKSTYLRLQLLATRPTS